ncbi:GroES-like protein [Dichomitus squalens]|uniref:GroES-like protein n=1 Tax=Dichomitus squalens TaxID=114155 RepID=A0A4Q9MX29_9APHY|nr:GroES-like protein [Dichomitus squalens LYAD-421 SS1]EJF64551.1 GroES-like protein [Dichomitus squalens LYAD-421 SS1]TBU32620.1 GroES-like protein [Dichomitus squalens]TBU43758.1 GroES-like protein [Dichomitus squalens]
MATTDSPNGSGGYMRAAVRLPRAKRPLVQMVEKPAVLPKTVLLEVAAAGVCESDSRLSIKDGRDSFVMGHEIVGYAREIGESVTGIELGALYAVWEMVPCSKAVGASPLFLRHGLGVDGGFAPFVLVDTKRATLVRVPDSLVNKPELAALAVDSTALVYHAVINVAKLQPFKGKGKSNSSEGEAPRVLVCGVGGLGHQALWLAKAYGATIFACDQYPPARQLAKNIGAERVFTFEELKHAAQNEKEKFTVDLVVDFVGSEASVKATKLALQPATADNNRGTLVIVRPRAALSGSVYDDLNRKYATHTVLECLAVDGLTHAFRLLAEGAIEPTLQRVALEDISGILDELEEGTLLGHRVVTNFEAPEAGPPSGEPQWLVHPLE